MQRHYVCLAEEFRESGGQNFPYYRRVMLATTPLRLLSVSDEAVILSTLLRWQAYRVALDTPEQELVLEALRRSTSALGPNATPQQVSEYLRNFNEQQLHGIVSNIKGIYHELAWEEVVNHDASSDHAQLFRETNHPLTDAVYVDADGDLHEVSLKTGSVEYVASQVRAHPKIRFVVNEEAYEALHNRYPNVHLESSGLSDAEMQTRVEDLIGDLEDPPDAKDFIPVATLWAVLFQIVPLIWEWYRGHLPGKECARRIAKITGLKAAKVAVLMGLLSNPVTGVPTSLMMLARMIWVIARDVIAV